jgi:hypothetical protein
VFEATDRWGGELRTIRVDGLPIDVGAEALHLGAGRCRPVDRPRPDRPDRSGHTGADVAVWARPAASTSGRVRTSGTDTAVAAGQVWDLVAVRCGAGVCLAPPAARSGALHQPVWHVRVRNCVRWITISRLCGHGRSVGR